MNGGVYSVKENNAMASGVAKQKIIGESGVANRRKYRRSKSSC